VPGPFRHGEKGMVAMSAPNLGKKEEKKGKGSFSDWPPEKLCVS